MNPSLEEKRQEIDALDDRVIEILARRQNISLQIAAIKREEGLPVLDKKREKAILDKRIKQGKEKGLNGLYIRSVFGLFFRESRRLQEEAIEKK